MEEKLIEALPFWQNLSEAQKLTLINNAVIKNFNKGQLIHGTGCSCLGMMIVLSGEVRTYMLSEEGREITLFRMYKDDISVLTASCIIQQITFETHVTAQTDVSAIIIGPNVFSKICEENIYAKCYLYELATERFSSVMWSLQQVLFKGFDIRLASFLLEEYERTGKTTINMTHEEIARHTSSAREVVARMLKRFSSENLVSFSRGTIELIDIEALRLLK